MDQCLFSEPFKKELNSFDKISDISQEAFMCFSLGSIRKDLTPFLVFYEVI